MKNFCIFYSVDFLYRNFLDVCLLKERNNNELVIIFGLIHLDTLNRVNGYLHDLTLLYHNRIMFDNVSNESVLSQQLIRLLLFIEVFQVNLNFNLYINCN